jgi:hypothetical protein
MVMDRRERKRKKPNIRGSKRRGSLGVPALAIAPAGDLHRALRKEHPNLRLKKGSSPRGEGRIYKKRASHRKRQGTRTFGVAGGLST